jgi:hypothetical protein
MVYHVFSISELRTARTFFYNFGCFITVGIIFEGMAIFRNKIMCTP